MIMETGEEGRQKTYSILITLNEKMRNISNFPSSSLSPLLKPFLVSYVSCCSLLFEISHEEETI